MKKLFVMGLCLVIGFSAFATKINIAIEKNTTNDGIVDNLLELESLFVEHQYNFLPISPPSSDVFTQDYGLAVPMRMKTLPKKFIKRLMGEYNEDGIPLFKTTVYEDSITRQTVFLNADGSEIYRLDPVIGYNPLEWQKAHFSLSADQVLDPWSAWIFDPAHIAAEFTLVPHEFYEAYILAEEKRCLEEIAMAPVMKTMGAGDGSTNMVVCFSADTNGIVSLAFTPPLGFGSSAEIFKKQNLIYPQLWSVAENRKIVTNSIETIWIDSSSSNNPTMFYILGDTSIDDDLDGYSNLREVYVSNSSPTNFNYVDADTDGLHDWYETMLFGNLNQTGSDDFDGDSLANNLEMVLHSDSVEMTSDPTLLDTDGDGTDDGDEVAQGSNPSDPGDGGQPPTPPDPPVTLLVQDRSDAYLMGGYTMKLSDGNNTYEISSSGSEAVSNTFNVVSGLSYTLTLTSKDFLPYTGAYTATVSGNGIVIEDPENILGVHDDNNTEVDLYTPGKTATVHVMKIGFNLNPVKVGLGEDRTSETEAYPETTSETYPYRLIAMITPKIGADSVTFESSNLGRVTVAEAPRTEVGDATRVVLEVTGISATPAGSPDGDAEIRAKISSATCATTKAVVIKPTTRSHMVGPAVVINSAVVAGSSATDLTTVCSQNVTITINDQFGAILHSIYNGRNVVEEKFVNINGGVWPSSWGAIYVPNRDFINGIKLDANGGSKTMKISVKLNPSQIQNWVAGSLMLNGAHNNTYALHGATSTEQADMLLRVDGHVVAPVVHRKVDFTSNNHPPSPITTTDS